MRPVTKHSVGTWRCGDGVERESTVMEHGGGDGDTILNSGSAVW